ncbi:MAG: DJ-1/PfpI family protein [Dysgonamonadaceae bacterium]|jgi:4-methyl-5(b-hydroxyethyl)-thiazole monophosphate biosynthesis|nr:DJ-1/PfpI family protein [Dysgonamonadaceae bacterium]
MKNVFLFLADGFEEIEAIATLDVLLRGNINAITVSITGNTLVSGAHGITIDAATLFEDADFSGGDMLILPGGMPGASNLNSHKELKELILTYADEGKFIAAICAAPLVLGGLGLMRGKRATVYPGYEYTLEGAEYQDTGVVRDCNIITGKGPGFALEFGLALVEALEGKHEADAVARGLLKQ